MATESSRATPALASRSAWSRRSSLRAWAPRRWASATVAALRAPWRSESAITPATTAAASSTPTPASSVRRRRLVRRWRSASRSLAARLSSRKARSSSLSSGSWLGGPVERRGEPGAAVELGRVAPGVAPLARRHRSGAGEGGGPRRPPRASRAGAATREAAPRGRPRPLPSSTVSRRLSVSTASARAASSSRSSSSSSSGTRRRTNASACSSSAPARRSSIGRARSRSAATEALVGVARQGARPRR